MTEKILCVDDDPNILQAYQRALRKRFHIDSALSGGEALEAIANRGPYAVLVADMRMPEMNGVELLKRVKENAPDTVRMMLTGSADQQTALEAVNEGHIFRFMTKPCPPETFAKVLEAGLVQYRLIMAERDLLTKTLSGSIKMLTEVLSLASPMAFGRASRVRRLVRRIVEELGLQETWQIEIAAMLSQVGCIAVDEDILAKVYRGEELSRKELEEYEAHPLAARQLIANIPRLRQVAEIVAYQEQRYDGQGFPADGKSGNAILPGSRILKVALDFDALVSNGVSNELALAEIEDRGSWYDPAVVAALRSALEITEAHEICQVTISKLVDGMVLADDVKSIKGTLLCTKGQEITPSLRARLRNYAAGVGIRSPIKIFVPTETAEQGESVHGESAG